MTFSGSYRSGEVEFLLKRLPLTAFASVREKEHLVRTARRHYSETLWPEALPSERYRRLFHEARRANRDRMAADCLRLASLIAARQPGPIAIASLARAGTPIGVVVARLLSMVFGRPTRHFSISIIRDRGIDHVALRHILAQGYSPDSIVFVDGWTGKGVLANDLISAVSDFNRAHGTTISTGLHVLSDLAGVAACAATYEDYLMPTCLLNATISGLISRTMLNDAIGPDDFHGCYVYDELAPYDESQPFVDELVLRAMAGQSAAGTPSCVQDRVTAAAISRDALARVVRVYGVRDAHLVKPGIGEATRALMRRVPERVLLRDADAASVAHLRELAHDKRVSVEYDPHIPYDAISILRWEPDD